jgi:hypothetical protein
MSDRLRDCSAALASTVSAVAAKCNPKPEKLTPRIMLHLPESNGHGTESWIAGASRRRSNNERCGVSLNLGCPART